MDQRGPVATWRRARRLRWVLQGCLGLLLFPSVAVALLVGWGFGGIRTMAPVVVGVAFGTWFLSAGAVLAVVLTTIVYRRNRLLDAAFATVGLHPRRVSSVERGFLGHVDGRGVQAWFARGPQVDLYLDCRSGRRLGVGRDRALLRVAGKLGNAQAVEVGDGLTAWADDPDWVDAFLQMEGVPETLWALCDTLPGASAHVIVGPEAVQLRVRHFVLHEWSGACDIEPVRIRAWLAGLGTLADALQSLPAGTATEGRVEGMSRLDRGRIHRQVMGCTVLALLGLGLAGALVAGWFLLR